MARFLVIGLDGAEPTLLEPWMDRGVLPNLARLRDRGGFAPLASTRPPVTFPAWTTCVTGVGPGRHGIFDFTELDHAARRVRFVNSSRRMAPAIWNVLSDAGKRSIVLGIPGTYPPEPIDGVLLSGFDSPVAQRVDVSCVYPRSTFSAVRDWRFADFQESHIGPGWHAMARARLLEAIPKKTAIACTLFASEPWDFAMIVYGEADTASHHFWLFHDSHSPRHRDGFASTIQDVYRGLDTAVGRLLDAVGDDTAVVVVSDHGFCGAGNGVVHLNNWLAERGHLRYAPQRGRSVIKRLGLALVPPSWRGTLFRRLRGLAESAESRSRFAGIDWTGTRAWSEELNYFPSIRINLRGRDPQGVVEADSYDAYVRDLCAELEAWAPIAKAWPRADLYDGPFVDRAPDIVLELEPEDGYLPAVLRSRGGAPFRRLLPEEHLGGKERGMTGVHRDPGILVASEPIASPSPSLADIAPTVYATLGLSAPPMDGRPLWGETAGRRDGAYVPTDAAYTEADEALIEARMRALGYYE